jgi:putative nucleotidyltransferase with HDIG domain
VGHIGAPAWIVGGGVRDALAGCEVADVDIALDGDAAAVARDLSRRHGAARFELSSSFGAWRVQGGRLPATVDITPLQGADIEADLRSRDFTVNAMAFPVSEGDGLFDPLGGASDLAAGRLRLVTEGALASDPVRLLRAARLAAQRGLRPDDEAVHRARADAHLLWNAAPERLWEELRRVLRLDEPDAAFAVLDDLRVLDALVPELARGRGMEQNPFHHRDVLGHTIEVVERVRRLTVDPEPVFRTMGPRVAARLQEPLADDLTRGQALVLAALLHDVAKPATREVRPDGRVTFMGHDRLGAQMAEDLCSRLRCANRIRDMVAHCVRQHLPLGFMVHRQPLTLRQIVRYLRLTAPAEVELVVLSVSDRLATDGPRTKRSAIDRHLDLARQVLRVQFDLEDRGPPPRLVAGDELARELGREPGPWLAELLADLDEEQLIGRVTTAERAIRFAQNWRAGR